jgi:tetratricopeptide (TPR) repeat protein
MEQSLLKKPTLKILQILKILMKSWFGHFFFVSLQKKTMMKKLLSVFFLICPALIFTANGQNADMVSKFKHLSPLELSDTANHFYKKNSFDTALVCYSLFIGKHTEFGFEHQERIVEAYNRSAIIHYQRSDYRTANELLVKALMLCEKIGYETYKPRILINFGNIYYSFDKFDLAKSYYERALNLTQDTITIVPILNNLGVIALKNGKLGDALDFFNKVLTISMRHDNIHLHNILHGLGEVYKEQNNYDSAYVYYKLALDVSRKTNQTKYEATCLSDLGKLFFEHNRIDSALFYIELSNAVAKKIVFWTFYLKII